MTSLLDENATIPKFEDLIGEGKKFRDQEAVAKAVFEKDAYIQRLEKEAEDARTELRARLTLEELSEKFVSKAPQPIQPTPVTSPVEADPKIAQPLDIAKLVAEELAKTKSTELTKANIEKSKAGLKDRFGGDFATALKGVAESLSVSTNFLDSVAAQSPEAFFNLVDSVKPRDDRRPTSPPQSGIDPNRGSPVSGAKNNKYFQELRRRDPKLYFSKSVQADLYRQAMDQGSKFYE